MSGMRVVRLGAWCDYVTEDEYRDEFLRSPAPEEPRDEPFPGPGLMDARAREEAWPEDLERFRRDASFRVHEFAVLADGRHLTLSTDRGFAISGPVDLWDSLTLEHLESDVLTTVLPDDEDTEEEHPWSWLSERLHAVGVEVPPERLKELPYEVVFSQRLRSRVSTQHKGGTSR